MAATGAVGASKGICEKSDPASPTSVVSAAKAAAWRYGACKAQGKMDHMEDHFLVVQYAEGMILGCVFDGHGGSEVAEYCASNVAELVKAQLQLVKSPEGDHCAVLKAAMAQLDPSLRAAHGSSSREQLVEIGGSTALVALFDRAFDKVTVAYLGDGRAILCRAGVAEQLNVEHNPCNPAERARVLAAGGNIDDCDRLDGENCSLSVSRAIGDFDFKLDETRPAEEQVVISIPDVREVKLEWGDEFLILSSDGTQCWSEQELVDFVRPRIQRQQQDLSSICEELLREVDGIDNMAVVIIKFT